MGEERVVIKIEVPRKDYEALEALASRRGYPLVSDFMRAVVGEILAGSTKSQINTKEIAEEIAKRLERKVVDLLNPFTAKIDDINRKLGELIELIEEKEKEEITPHRAVERKTEKTVERARKTSAIERLKEQKIVIYSDVAWMKAPRKLFEKLEREGAIVFEVAGELIAVDPEFWDKFVKTVSEISISDLDKVKSLLEGGLGEEATRLFQWLLRGGLAYYDHDLGQWIINVKRHKGPTSG